MGRKGEWGEGSSQVIDGSTPTPHPVPSLPQMAESFVAMRQELNRRAGEAAKRKYEEFVQEQVSTEGLRAEPEGHWQSWGDRGWDSRGLWVWEAAAPPVAG